ncbi:hypothetical protein [Amycolatopsis jejuensis]|uniref:hypothetical protein n=1 Tax=Amycolatopsis jejuensis TaxID=330084 RepID=UPI001FE14C0C|nr:hypothetical protein [Amycolatopsis jejuensis]
MLVVGHRQLRTLPVVADAGVHHDHRALAAQHPRLHRAAADVGFRAPVIRREPRLVVPPQFGRARDQNARRSDLALPFDNPDDFYRTQMHNRRLSEKNKTIHGQKKQTDT